jgi:hypothetical protein
MLTRTVDGVPHGCVRADQLGRRQACASDPSNNTMQPGYVKLQLQPYRAAREGRNKWHRPAAERDTGEATVRAPSGPW